MANFTYQAIDQNSLPSEGEITAISAEEVATLLKKRGLTVVSIEEAGKGKLGLPFKKNVSLKEKILFTSHLATMIKAGLPLVSGIEVLISDSKNPNFRQILEEIRGGLEKGRPLNENLARFPNVFDPSYIAIVKAGETGGQLAEVLKSLANKLKRDLELRNRIRGALLYPSVIFVTLILVGMAMMIFVIPKVVVVFERMQLSLPLPTRILVASTKILTFNYFLTFAFLGGLALALIFVLRSLWGRKVLASLGGRLPWINSISQAVDLARLTSSLSILLKAGVSVDQGLAISSEAVVHPGVKKALTESSIQMKEGKTIAESLREKEVIPKVLVQIVDVGEKTGTLDQVLESLSRDYDEEVTERLKNFTSLLEPILMVLIGLAVGAFVLSIIGPIYQVVGKVGGG